MKNSSPKRILLSTRRPASSIPYASFLCYSVRGSSKLSATSRGVKDAVKFGKSVGTPPVPVYQHAARRLREALDGGSCPEGFSEWFTPATVLVPMPRSSPLHDPAALWPPREICIALHAAGFGSSVETALARTFAVPKSHLRWQTKDPPVTVEKHRESMEVSRGMLPLETITIVDDFITSGATAFGAFLRLSETFPDVPIRVFALVRSLSDDEADEIISPVIGSIKRRKNGLATRRP